MAQREGSVYLWLFVVAMMLFVLVTVLFVFKNQEHEEMGGKLTKAQKAVVEANAVSYTHLTLPTKRIV